MAAFRNPASQSWKFDPFSFKDTLSIKERNQASLGSGADGVVLVVEDGVAI
jgi:hypothetical protein